MESIHILGLGNMGKYLAYGLRRCQQASTSFLPPTLLFHRPGLLDDWEGANRSIRYTDKTRPGSPATEGPRAEGFRVELVEPIATQGQIENHSEVVVGSITPIKYLVVATKAYAVATALAPLKHRLDRNSHILFLHNGMGEFVHFTTFFQCDSILTRAPGVRREVSESIFPDPKTRPAYWAGVCSAGVYSEGPFSIVHAGRGPLVFGALEDQTTTRAPPDGGSMAAQLSGVGMLETQLVSSQKIIQAQLTKLVANAIINPLTALFNCRNGEILRIDAAREMIDPLVREAGAIIRALPSFQDEAEIRASFADDKLRSFVDRVATATAGNTSSMLQDVRAGRRTEIDYINAYLVRKGEELGKPHEHHESVVRRIKQLEPR